MSWLVRYAGIAYLASFAVPVATWLVFFAGEVDGSDLDTAMATVRHGAASLRIAVLCETLGSTIHLALGLLLYAVLRATGRHLALSALVFKITESVLTAVIALGHLTALSMLELQVHPEAASTLLPVTGFVGIYLKLTAIPGVFFGASMLLFALLLGRAKCSACSRLRIP